MAQWILANPHKCSTILDPAFGLGVFGSSILKKQPNIKITGYDIDDVILNVAKSNFSTYKDYVSVCKQDYLTSSWNDKYDGIICNPPYLKFHDYDNSHYISEVNNHLGTRLNGFTNLYTLFLLKSISQLKEGGRLAYIIPSEFLNSDYGVEVKRALIESNTLKHIIIVDFTKCAFDDALTTASILLCENNGIVEKVNFTTVNEISKLSDCFSEFKSYAPDDLDVKVKWKQYYDQTCASKYSHLVPFSTFAKVSRGIATGSNDFFTFNRSKLDDYNINERYVLPCICHAQDVKTHIFTSDDFHLLSERNKVVYLFNGCSNENNLSVRKYIKIGEQLKIDKRYLTASRSPWYSIENRTPAPIWVSVFNRSGLKFVRNEANVRNLTTFHCIYNSGRIESNVLFAYLLTNVAKRIFLDNSRQYGNGLVKFEPNDLNNGKVLDLSLLTDREIVYIKRIYDIIKKDKIIIDILVNLLDIFFTKKFTGVKYDIEELILSLEQYKKNKTDVFESRHNHNLRVKQLNFFDVMQQYPEYIVENSIEEPSPHYVRISEADVDLGRNVLVSLVKDDNVEHYLDQTATIYYTGKRFPSSVALNKLYYFMPYIKRKGIRDLYLIKIARVGTRKEGQPDNNPNDFRLVFEIEFVKRLFNNYKPIELDIWHTFTDTTINALLMRINK